MSDSSDLREAVRGRYARAALQVLQPRDAAGPSCCGSEGCCVDGCGSISSDLYSDTDLAELPREAALASLGCGNPTALAALNSGEVVLDLGSGGGIDVLLSARRVGPTGKAYGLDMTDEMLALARQNAERSGATNVEFLKGRIEDIPLPSDSVDVIISNCVINLSTNKEQVIREAFRVLKPGGRLAVSDVVVDGPVPADLRRRVELWVGCIAGALDHTEYRRILDGAGFVDVAIEPTRVYSSGDLGDPELTAWLASQPEPERSRLDRAFFSAFIRARKPTR